MMHQWELVEKITGDNYVIIQLCLRCGWLKETSPKFSGSRFWHTEKVTFKRAGQTITAKTVAKGAPTCDGLWPDGWKPQRRYHMFLDDLRQPPRQKDIRWVVVRSFDEAVAYIEKHGMPFKISFDHDLGDGIPTGYDLAKWLVEKHLDGEPLPEGFRYAVHSANPPGAANIKGLLDNFLTFLEIERRVDEQEVMPK